MKHARDEYVRRYQRILDLEKLGKSGGEIARELGISKQRVSQILQEGRPKPRFCRICCEGIEDSMRRVLCLNCYSVQIETTKLNRINRKQRNKLRRQLLKKRQKEKLRIKLSPKIRKLYPLSIQAKLARTLRSRLKAAIRQRSKSGSAVRDLGCSINELKDRFDLMFSDGMNWDNYGKWHIDHIKPLSAFDLSERRQLLQACHYTNLQPLWAKDNLRKSAKFEVSFRESSSSLLNYGSIEP